MDKKLKEYLEKYDWLWENNTPLPNKIVQKTVMTGKRHR